MSRGELCVEEKGELRAGGGVGARTGQGPV